MIGTSKVFLDEHFLLESEYAQVLYEQFAAPMPILDFHNHLSPKDIAENRRFRNLTEIWLEGDHYKWRAMRFNGVAERYCTGDASPKEKFQKWAETVPFTMRNPLHHWTHLELKTYFGIDQLLNADTASKIYEVCSEKLQENEFSAQNLLRRMKVEVVCTTDDPSDTLEYHKQFADEKHELRMYPTFRPDKSYAVDHVEEYLKYLTKLGNAADVTIRSFDDLIVALRQRVEFFASLGCRAADHGLEYLPYHSSARESAPKIIKKILTKGTLDQTETDQFRCAVLLELCRMYHEKQWVQQFHIGALRNNNSRLLRTLGPDTGFDSMGEFPQARSMSRFLDTLDQTDQLAKTIIYNNNPNDNEVIATMIGNFNDGSFPGKIQLGSGWWFLDQKDGMERQMNALSNMGLLSRFVGMVTDSRSLLSFTSHEYFRRILCNLWDNDIVKGQLPDDMHTIGQMIEAICYYNTKEYFRF